MRCSGPLRGQRGFSLIEVLTASMVLSIFIIAIGACWVTTDRRINDLVMRQKAIFVANAEMERVTVLYDTTSFGVLGPVTTTGYTGPAFLPSTRLIYPNSLSGYTGGGADFTTNAVATFQGDAFLVYIDSQLLPVLNRAYLWVDQDHGVMARVSWKTTNITPSACVVGGDGCGCLSYGGIFSGACQKLDLYLEYPYRLVSGSPTADANLQTVILSTIVGRHT
jgi:prepilin-type N-terminal cleavage/methylation domain-containing protein